ncbi:MAG: M3 family oligoendopeptidase [Clostridia bacterium]|nr:M3 family oligoendopeptidase [Clostridia bacterium]
MNGNWDLAVFYNGFDDPRIENDFARVNELLPKAREALDSGEPAAAVMERMADLEEELHLILGKLGSFANLTLATDAANAPAMQLMDRVMQLSVPVSMLSSAYSRYLGAMDAKELEDAIASSEKLQAVGFHLRRSREEALHLPAPEIEEWLLRMSLDGANAFSTLRDQLDATLLVDYRGEQLPLSAVRGKAEDPDPQVRRDAYMAELAAYKKIEVPMAACLNGIKGQGLTMIEAEHFDSILAESLYNSNMDQQTLDAMWTACREFFPDFRRYLRKKGELLGHSNGLPFYDLFAPLQTGDAPAKTYTVEEAHDILLRELGKFTPDMAEFIDHAFKNNWIDLYPRPGKGGGAFCAGVEHVEQSRVLTNFTGSLGDVSTLAHELGHAWHNRCMSGLPQVMRGAPMPLAETASIFNETLLANALRQGMPHEQLLGLLDTDLQNSTQVVVDIYSRFLFESAVIEGKKTHNLSVEEMKQLMLDAQDQSYGEGLDPEYRHPYMWACKSHYYIPGLGFYNFPYAFGLLFGKGVYAQYLEKGAAFVPTYNQLLRSCGSDMVADVAASVGIDVRSVDFWRASLQTIREDIDLFISLADEQLKA